MYEKDKLTSVEAAWVAAVIDCEGMITVHTPWNKQRQNRNLQFYTRVHMTDLGVIDRLHKLCGGSKKACKRAKPHYLDSWYWNVSSNGMRWLLPQLLPFLIAKHRHAEIALEILSRNRRGFRGQMPFTELEPLLVEMRSLQKGGYKGDISKIRATFRNPTTPHTANNRNRQTGRYTKVG